MPSIGTLLPRRQLYLLAGLAAGLLLLATGTYQRDRLPTSSQPWCTNDQLSTGQWESIKVDGHTWPRLKQSVGYLCADRNHALHCFEEEPTQLPRLAQANSWRWKPDGCALRPFDTEALVDKLGANARRGAKGSGILFVGDSLQLQQVQSFECLMGEHVEEGYISDYEIGSLKLEKGAGKVEFVRTDYMIQPDTDKIMLPEEEEPANHTRFDRKWSHMVEDKSFVVVNTGAHWGDHRVAQLNRYTEMAKSVISFIDSFPHTTLIVRSSVPGHKGCSQYSSPLLEDDPESHNSYNWQGFVLFNTIWKDLLDPHPKHHYLDVGATSLRGDGHRLPDKDCLHYCLPGPVDTWNVLLNHIIMGS